MTSFLELVIAGLSDLACFSSKLLPRPRALRCHTCHGTTIPVLPQLQLVLSRPQTIGGKGGLVGEGTRPEGPKIKAQEGVGTGPLGVLGC